MPTLHWIGKDKVINHHMDVPFRVLEHNYGYGNGEETQQETQSGNKIIHGDNLEALKALLPEYEGKIKCIYIDPPYNTGEENWIYNDNVSDDKIKKWLGQVVGREGEDLTRHDKWLCMMYPRLKLLHKLLDETGAIIISIDDKEIANLILICNEIFGIKNFVSNMIWQSRTSISNDQEVSLNHNHTLIYSKNRTRLLFYGNPLNVAEYSNPDNDVRGPWKLVPIDANKPGGDTKYPITNPKTGREYYPPSNRSWAINRTDYEKLYSDGRIKFGLKDDSSPKRKLFLHERQQKGDYKTPSSILLDAGSTKSGTDEIMKIFDNQKVFPYPKPSSLIQKLISFFSINDELILDSFAGSGTTAHAVLKLNNADGGRRKFILIERENYADTITAERVKRVIKGYGDTEGTGGSFDYYTLGQPMFLEDGMINELVGTERIRQYVYYTETNTPLVETKHKDNEYYLGKYNDTAYYFHYEQDGPTTLDHDFLATIKTKAEQYVIYADNCLLSKEYLKRNHIIFKKIPRDITRF